MAVFSFSELAFSSLSLRLSYTISSSLFYIYRDVSLILVLSSSSKRMIFCSRFQRSIDFSFIFLPSKLMLVSAFLNIFSFSKSFFLHSSLNYYRNSISFCFNVILNFDSSAFFQVSNSQIILYSISPNSSFFSGKIAAG